MMSTTTSDAKETMPRSMPRYKCHKVVYALKIVDATVQEDGSVIIQPADETCPSFLTDPGIGQRFEGVNADDPGYYIVYKDGYCSWSPTKAFEDGYRKIHAAAGDEYLNIQLQDGPIGKNGVNGCQIDDVILFCRDKVLEFNSAKFSCRENAMAITKLDEALMWLQRRTQNREARQVEGTNQA